MESERPVSNLELKEPTRELSKAVDLARKIVREIKDELAARQVRRWGALPPMLVVLITVASLVAASLVAYFIYSTTRSATQQPIVQVTEAYTDGTRVFFTVRNVGSIKLTSLSISQASCTSSSGSSISVAIEGCTPATLDVGKSAVCRLRKTGGALDDGSRCVVQLSASGYSISIAFKVIRP